MVALKCCHCGSESLVKFGFSHNGKQRYKCKACGRASRESPASTAHDQVFREQILAAYNERMSLRGIQRAFGVSRQTVTSWLKKDQQMLARQSETGVPYLQETLLPAQDEDVLELDELWSFVGTKKNAVWIWVALCRRTRQVAAWHFGPRDELSCVSLWHKIPPQYQKLTCYSDGWNSYQKVIPPDQHRACGKEEGATNHVERFNLTLRQRLARLVRKTLSFSKDLLWHLRHLRLFLVYYNRYCVKRFNSY